jgi:hypothetical protein
MPNCHVTFALDWFALGNELDHDRTLSRTLVPLFTKARARGLSLLSTQD